MKKQLEKLENSEMKLTITLTAEEFEKYRNEGFKKVQEFVQIDGFRKGNAPEDMIVKKYGDMVIFEEMSHIAINDTYYKAIIEENENKKEDDKIFPISNPKINVTKLGKGSDFEYVAEFAVMPKFEVPNYKKIAKEEAEKAITNELEDLQKINKDAKKEDLYIVNDNEVSAAIESLRKARNAGAHVHEDGTVHTHSHDEHEHIEENIPDGGDSLPELNDEFAQSFGETFKTMDDLKNKIKENIELEKNAKILDKKRNYVLERLVTDSNIYIPNILLEEELERMKLTMKNDVERYGSKWEEYLSYLKKTEEDLKIDWKDVAEKRVKSQLILNAIAKKENIEVSKDEIFTEALKIMNQMPEANEDSVRNYVHQILQNEKVMNMLDGEMK